MVNKLEKNINESLKNNGEKVCSFNISLYCSIRFNWTSVSFDRVQESILPVRLLNNLCKYGKIEREGHNLVEIRVKFAYVFFYASRTFVNFFTYKFPWRISNIQIPLLMLFFKFKIYLTGRTANILF